jgi:hypothetical protein
MKTLLVCVAVATSSTLLAQRPLNRANLDTTCAACTDFYQFANGGWLKKNVIPPDKANLGSFGMLGDKNQEVVQKIVIDDALLVRDGEAKAGSNDWKIGTFYASCMDTTLMEKDGAKPIKPALDAIAAAKTTDDVVKLFGSRALRGGGGGGGRGGGGGAHRSRSGHRPIRETARWSFSRRTRAASDSIAKTISHRILAPTNAARSTSITSLAHWFSLANRRRRPSPMRKV